MTQPYTHYSSIHCFLLSLFFFPFDRSVTHLERMKSSVPVEIDPSVKEEEEARFQANQDKLDSVLGKIKKTREYFPSVVDVSSIEALKEYKASQRGATALGIVVVAVSLTNFFLFLIWLLTTHAFPWFIYPVFGSVALGGMIYIPLANIQRKLLVLHFFLSTMLNLTILSTWIFAYTPHPWFIYVLIPSISLALFHSLLSGLWEINSLKHKWFYIHLLCIYIPLNVLLFISWTSTRPSTPWFIYPFFGTSFALIPHFFSTFYAHNPHKWVFIHASLSSSLNVFSFLVWYITGHGFPWFVFVWIGLTAALALHLYSIHGALFNGLVPPGVRTNLNNNNTSSPDLEVAGDDDDEEDVVGNNDGDGKPALVFTYGGENTTIPTTPTSSQASSSPAVVVVEPSIPNYAYAQMWAPQGAMYPATPNIINPTTPTLQSYENQNY